MISNLLPKHKTIIWIIVAVSAIKLFLFIWAYLNFNFVTHHPVYDWLNIWDRWDTDAYKTIATSAYLQTDNMNLEKWAFINNIPPLYPATIYVVSLVGISIPISGYLVSFLSIVIASIILYKLALSEFKNKQTAFLTILFFNLFPTSYFTNTIYSEPLFLLLTISCFYYLRKERFILVAILASGVILTRNVGLVLIPFLCLYSLYDYHKHRRISINQFYLCFIPIFTVIIYMCIHKYYFGNYFYFVKEASHYDTKHLILPFKETYQDIIAVFQNSNLSNQEFMTTRGWNAIFSLYALAITIYGATKMKWEYTFYSLSMIILFCSMSWGISNARYAFSVFPMFMILGSVENKLIQGFTLGVFFIILLYFTKIFTSGAWSF
jgi:Gpi18-like mannosyltransferase